MRTNEVSEFIKDPEFFKKLGIAPMPVRIGIMILISILVFAFVYWMFISPRLQSIEQLKDEEQKLLQEFDRQQKKAVNLVAYREQLEDMEQSFLVMVRQLPDKTEVDSLLVDLSQTSSANNLKVDVFKPLGEVAKEFYAEYPIELRVFGQFHELAKFVSDVAALPRIVTLHDIKISKIDKKDGQTSNDLGMEMIAKTYRYLEDSE